MRRVACTDCVFHRLGVTSHICRAVEDRFDPVTGVQFVRCEDARALKGPCGPYADLFVPIDSKGEG